MLNDNRLCVRNNASQRIWSKFKELIGKHCQPRILHSDKMSLKQEGEIKTFSDTQKWEEFIISRPVLQEIEKEYPQAEGE